jgi:hypothetical protein
VVLTLRTSPTDKPTTPAHAVEQFCSSSGHSFGAHLLPLLR